MKSLAACAFVLLLALAPSACKRSRAATDSSPAASATAAQAAPSAGAHMHRYQPLSHAPKPYNGACRPPPTQGEQVTSNGAGQ